MRKLLLVLMLAVMTPAVVMAQKHKSKQKKADAETMEWKYEIVPASVGTQGNVVLMVWSYSANPNVAAEQAKKNAVHGVIFKGIPSTSFASAKKPLVTNEEEHAEFFNEFFAQGGDYMRFVTLSNADNQKVTKVDRRRYKVGVTVAVLYDNLRKELESKGIVKRLDSGF